MFLCNALILNEIYLPMNFYVDALYSFKVAPDKKGTDGRTEGRTSRLLYAILRRHINRLPKSRGFRQLQFEHNQVVIRISYKSITIGNIKCEVTVYHVITFHFYQRNRFKTCKTDDFQFSKY